MNKRQLQSILTRIVRTLRKSTLFKERNSQREVFYTRLGCHFDTIFTLFHHLYGERNDFEEGLEALITALAENFCCRPSHLRESDARREEQYSWFLSEQHVGMALYADRFAKDLKGVAKHIPYLQELGVNLLHLMPVMDFPSEAGDGGYAVRDFRKPKQELGSTEDLLNLSRDLRKNQMLLTLDVVLNHTSDQHEWAQKAKEGNRHYEDFYYTFDTKEETAIFEQSMPEIFPETSPGSFTFNEELQKWVMTVFNSYQWDLNYRNPNVFIEMMNIIFFYANSGADILRLDAVAFLWKIPGTTCQNLPQAHKILQLIKACTAVTAPGVAYIAEAIVAPDEVVKYLGTEESGGNAECDIAYNATFMALLWDGVATKNTRLLRAGLKSIPHKPENTTWLNYLRCHDDIGLGFSDEDIEKSGYRASTHRRFLIDYFTKKKHSSDANGVPFGENDRTGDARIAGTLASLIGLDEAIKSDIKIDIDLRINQILMLHSLIFSFGGIPLLYYGDELGTANYVEYLEDEHLCEDSRWIHRPVFSWNAAKRRKREGTVEHRLFYGISKFAKLRKTIPLLSDANNTAIIELENESVLAILRFSSDTFSHDYDPLSSSVLSLANFAATPQFVNLPFSNIHSDDLYDICTGKPPQLANNQLLMPPFSWVWLTRMPL